MMKTALESTSGKAVAIAAALAVALPGSAEAAPNTNSKARATATSIGARVIRLYEEVRSHKREGVIAQPTIDTDAPSIKTISFSVDSHRSLVAKSNSKRSFDIGLKNTDHRVLNSISQRMNPKDVVYIDMSVGGAKNPLAVDSPFEFGVAFTMYGKVINRDAWTFDGEYLDSSAKHQTVVNGSTNPRKFAGPLLSVSKLIAAADQMNGIISDAVHDRPVDVLPAPFHGEVYKVQ